MGLEWLSKQIGMGAGTMENNSTSHRVNFERSGKLRFQHGLIVRVQIHQHFFKRIVQLSA